MCASVCVSMCVCILGKRGAKRKGSMAGVNERRFEAVVSHHWTK